MAEPDRGELLLTYAELAERLGVSADGARTRARRAGWPVRVGNDGKARVRVRAAELPERPPERPARPVEHTPVESGRLSERELLDWALRENEAAAELAQLREQLARVEERLQATERVTRTEIEAARRVAAVEVEAARRLAEAEVAAREALLQELRAALAEARRPWWRKLLGR